METKEKTLEEQEAPLKNTDHAFVQVGHNGEPIVPRENEKGEQQNSSPNQDSVQKKS